MTNQIKWSRFERGTITSKCGRWTIVCCPSEPIGNRYQLRDHSQVVSRWATAAAAKFEAQVVVERERQLQDAAVVERARGRVRERLILTVAEACGIGAVGPIEPDDCNRLPAPQLRQLAATLRQLANACEAEAAALAVPEGASGCRRERDQAVERARCTTTDGGVEQLPPRIDWLAPASNAGQTQLRSADGRWIVTERRPGQAYDLYDRKRGITSALLPTWTDCCALALRWLTWEPEQQEVACRA